MPPPIPSKCRDANNPCDNYMNNCLVLTACGQYRPDLLEQFTLAIKDSGCNIRESRTLRMGDEICLIMMLSGTWDAIAKIEGLTDRLENRLELSIIKKRTGPGAVADNQMPYAIDVVSYDHEGIVYAIVDFILKNHISIQEMTTTTYRATNSNTTMFSLHMIINIPTDVSIASIRGDFMDFCDQLNLDAIMEPVK